MNPQLAQMYLAALGGGGSGTPPPATYQPTASGGFNQASANAAAEAVPQGAAITPYQSIGLENPATVQQTAQMGGIGGIRGRTPQNPGAAALGGQAPQQQPMPFGW
jgi:hypothetical protein